MEDREVIRSCEFDIFQNKNKIVGAYRFDVLITSYDTLSVDFSYLKDINFYYIIVDEAQRLKNPYCSLRAELLKLKFFKSVLLTGTPIQNNMTELWSLLNFVDAIKYLFIYFLIVASLGLTLLKILLFNMDL